MNHFRMDNFVDSPDAGAMQKRKSRARVSNISLISGSSMDSFISAVSSKEDLVSFDATDGPCNSFKPLISPALAKLYGEHLTKTTCSNWKYKISEDLHRRRSLINGLKVSGFLWQVPLLNMFDAPYIEKSNAWNGVENLEEEEYDGMDITSDYQEKHPPSGCNVNENTTPRSSMISLRKGYIWRKILGPRISKRGYYP